MTNILLWLGGAVVVGLSIWRIRRPYARLAELDQLAENARRYDSWRGNRSPADDRQSGADVMRQLLRRELVVWTVVGVVGVVMVFAGFAIR